MISQPTYVRRVFKQELKSHLLLVDFHFVLAQFQIKRGRFSKLLPTYIQLCTQIVVLFKAYSAANCFSSPKNISHTQQQPIQRFPSPPKLVDLNDGRKLQYTPNKVSIFESSLNDLPTIRLVLLVIYYIFYS